MKPRDGGPCAVVMGLDVCGYGIVRSLAREHVPMVGLWRRADECGRFSRYCAAEAVAPDDDAAWLAALLALAARYDRPVLFPSNDRFAELLARHRGGARAGDPLPLGGCRSLGTVIDKARIGAVCGRPARAPHAPAHRA